MKVYIAGKITGCPDYFEAFAEAAFTIRTAGDEPVNPCGAPEGLTYRQYINRALKLLMKCDAIYMLPGWKDSKGAKLEKTYAETVGLPRYLL